MLNRRNRVYDENLTKALLPSCPQYGSAEYTVDCQPAGSDFAPASPLFLLNFALFKAMGIPARASRSPFSGHSASAPGQEVHPCTDGNVDRISRVISQLTGPRSGARPADRDCWPKFSTIKILGLLGQISKHVQHPYQSRPHGPISPGSVFSKANSSDPST